MSARTASIRSIHLVALILAAVTSSGATGAQAPMLPGQQASGPVIQSTGMSFKVDDPTFLIPANHDFKAVFVISAGGPDTVKVNEQVVSLARFYNHTVRNGIAESRVHAAAVFHGNGWQAILNDSAYTARFGKANPSRRVIEELVQHGATLVLCGQTAGRAGVKKEELLPGVKLAISAMTAFEYLQSQGYQYIPW